MSPRKSENRRDHLATSNDSLAIRVGHHVVTSLLDLLEDASRSDGTLSFLPGGPVRVRPAQLLLAADRAARWWRQVSFPGEAVAMVLSSSFDALAVLIGAWRIGLKVASLPYPARAMSESAYRAQVERMCKLAGARRLMVDPAYLGLLEGSGLRATGFDAYIEQRVVVQDSIGDSTKAEFVQFTSGSTSEPKGVSLSLEALGNHVVCLLQSMELEPEERACTWVPLTHDMGLMTVLTSICAGSARWNVHGTTTVLKPELFLSDPAFWLKAISQQRSTFTVAPSFALGLAARLLRTGTLEVDLSSLRQLIIGAEPIRADVLRTFGDAATPYGFNTMAICPGYGLAEATVGVTFVRASQHWRSQQVETVPLGNGAWVPTDAPDDESGGQVTEVVSCGEPLPGVEIRIAPTNATRGDCVGKIEVRSPSLFTKYLGAPCTPQEVTHDGWFTTGDLGITDESGELFVVGRSDDVILVAGRNLYAIELERAASKHPSVRPGNCVAVADGKGRYVLVCEPNADTSSTLLRDACRELKTLLAASFNASPRSVLFVSRGSVPKTPSGKIRRNALAIMVRQGTLDVHVSG